MNLAHLAGLAGSDNDGGLKCKLFICPIDDFLLIKGPKTTTAAGDSVTIDGSHTFTSPKGFWELYLTLDSAELKFTPVGETDGRSNKVELEWFYPGNEKDVAELSRRVKNMQCLIIVEYPDGKKEQIGTEGIPCEVVSEFGSGRLSGGRRGYTFKAMTYMNSKMFYEGTITLNTAV